MAFFGIGILYRPSPSPSLSQSNRSYQRLEYENLLGEADLQENGEYYRNAAAFGLKYFAYYMCFKCKEPYFGGQPRCDDGLDHFDPSELICGACSGIGVAECAKQ